MREIFKKKVCRSNIMWNVFQSIFFSLILIVFCHFGFQYLKDWLTPHKKKDLVDFQIKKYKKMLEEIIQKKKTEEENQDTDDDQKLFFFEDTYPSKIDGRSSPIFNFTEKIMYEPSVNDDTRSEIDSVDYKSMQKELLDFTKLI